MLECTRLAVFDDSEVVNFFSFVLVLIFHRAHLNATFLYEFSLAQFEFFHLDQLAYTKVHILPFMDSLFLLFSYMQRHFGFDDSSSSICHFCVNKRREENNCNAIENQKMTTIKFQLNMPRIA